MISYLLFSLKRRWMSRSSIIVFGLSFLVAMGLLFVDVWFTQNKTVTIQWPSHLSTHLEEFKSFDFISDKAMIKVTYNEPSHYTIHDHKTNVSKDTLVNLITYAHQRYVLDSFNEQDQMKIVMMLEPTIDSINPSHAMLPLMFISFLYFTLLGFSSNLSSDILSEKHSQALIMILSTMNRRRYFSMKIYQSILNIVIQSGLIIMAMGIVLFLRNNLDSGTGLLTFLYEQQWLPVKLTSFEEIITLIFNEVQISFSFAFASMSFLIGLMTCMLLLLLLSLNAQRSEDLASIQTPYYILIVLLYYGSLWISELPGLNQRISPWIIHLPIISMIFHPLQLMMHDVSVFASLFSLILGSIMLIFTYKTSLKSFEKKTV